jgi:hypothetical protein
VYALGTPKDGAGAEELLDLLLCYVPGQTTNTNYKMIVRHLSNLLRLIHMRDKV